MREHGTSVMRPRYFWSALRIGYPVINLCGRAHLANFVENKFFNGTFSKLQPTSNGNVDFISLRDRRLFWKKASVTQAKTLSVVSGIFEEYRCGFNL